MMEHSLRAQNKEIHFSFRAFMGLLFFMILPWIIVLLTIIPEHVKSRVNIETAAENRDGSWGRLEINDIAIAPVDIIIPGQLNQYQQTTWMFNGLSDKKLCELFISLGLPDIHQSSLLDTNCWIFTAEGIIVRPTDDSILALSSHQRKRLYKILGSYPENINYFHPWSMKTTLFKYRLENSGLTEDAKALVKQLAYIQGSRTFVSDGMVLLNRLKNTDQKQRVIRLLISASTYQVHLVIPHNADVDAIANYWGVLGGRRKDIKPILESLSQLPKGGKLDIAHLLPAFARQRLYIYPSPVLAQDGARRDCHWTSLNFSSLTPDNTFGDPKVATLYILEHYSQISEKPQFGDLVLCMLPDGNSIHSAVYIAGKLVFTKNGETMDQPWIIMDLDELQELYSYYYHTAIDVQYWRLK